MIMFIMTKILRLLIDLLNNSFILFSWFDIKPFDTTDIIDITDITTTVFFSKFHQQYCIKELIQFLFLQPNMSTYVIITKFCRQCHLQYIHQKYKKYIQIQKIDCDITKLVKSWMLISPEFLIFKGPFLFYKLKKNVDFSIYRKNFVDLHIQWVAVI